MVLNRRKILIKRIKVKQVINHEQSAANKRFNMQKKKHENTEICIKEKY